MVSYIQFFLHRSDVFVISYLVSISYSRIYIHFNKEPKKPFLSASSLYFTQSPLVELTRLSAFPA